METFQKYTLQGQVLLPLARKQRSKLRRGQSLQEHSLSHTAGTLKGLAARLVSEKCDCHPVALLGSVLISTGLISASKPGADSRQPCYSMVSIFLKMYFIDNAVLISAVQHSDFSYTRVCVYIYIHTHSFSLWFIRRY